jgi:hypothetical protein
MCRSSTWRVSAPDACWRWSADVVEVAPLAGFEAFEREDGLDVAVEARVLLERPALEVAHFLLEAVDRLDMGRLDAREHGRLERVHPHLDALGDVRERVDELVEDAVDGVFLGHPGLVQAVVQRFERGERMLADGDHEAAGDVDVQLQRLEEPLVVVVALACGVEDEQHVIPVVVELRRLPELLGVLDRQCVEAQQLAEHRQLLRTRTDQVQPEELVIAPERRAACLVDGRQDVHGMLTG